MTLNNLRAWLIVAGATGAVAAQITEYFLTSSWRAAAHKDPPEDPTYEDVDWRSAIVWTIVAATATGLTQLVARHGAGVAWKRVTGKRPPQPRRRPRRRSLRDALV